MSQDEIKNYDTEEELKADYENYRGDWDYDPHTQSAKHKSGFKIRKTFFGDRLAISYDNLPEWKEQQRGLGKSDEEINLYRRMLHNQFYMINTVEPYEDPELTAPEPTYEELYQEELKSDLDWIETLKGWNKPQHIIDKNWKFLSSTRESRARDALDAYRELHSEMTPEEEEDTRQYYKALGHTDEYVEEIVTRHKAYHHKMAEAYKRMKAQKNNDRS